MAQAADTGEMRTTMASWFSNGKAPTVGGTGGKPAPVTNVSPLLRAMALPLNSPVLPEISGIDKRAAGGVDFSGKSRGIHRRQSVGPGATRGSGRIWESLAAPKPAAGFHVWPASCDM